MELIPITSEDLPMWRLMREELYTDCSSEEHETEMHIILKRDDHFAFFVRNEFRFIGLVELSKRNIVDGCISSPVAYVEGLYLVEAFRGQGIGKEIMSMIATWCKDNGLLELATDAELGNTKAQAFYQKLGFERTGEIVGFRKKVD